MKRFYAFFLLAAMSLSALYAEGEGTKVPMDPAIRHGVLANGLTYYIRHNEEPKDRASFYIVQNVGAILENDDQNGLAHFLEHMAFNGTENFNGKGIINYLEKYGVAFGRNINAYTGQDETVYNLSNVPTTHPQLIDSCLLILNDWSNYLSLTNEEIDAERGVISEEWRTRRNAGFRMRNKESEMLYADSKYSKRDVIGDLDVIKTFKHQTIKDFYNDWYRTDLQAIVIVGDLDVDAIEKSIKERFSKIPAVKNPKERKLFEVPDNKEPRYALATDAEARSNYINLTFKFDPVKPENKDAAYLRQLFIKSLFSSMMNDRLQEPLQKENPPYMNAQAYSFQKYRTKSIAGLYIGYKDGNALSSLKAAATILEQARDFGFTQTELDRAKMDLFSQYENAYKKRDKVNHDRYAMEYKDHYLINEPIAGIEFELRFLSAVLPQITVEEVNAMTARYFTDENLLITVSGPEAEGVSYPGKDEIVDVINKVKAEKLEAYVDSFEAKPLMANIPAAGKITSRKKIEQLGAEELILSNGIKVYVKQSDLEKEKVMFKAQSWGGSSKVADKNLANAMVATDFISSYGVGEFSAMDLQKLLTGKIVKLNPWISDLSEGFTGQAAPKDLETMFQLLHLQFVQPRFDDQVYNALYTRYMAYVKNMGNDINNAFRDSISVTMADHHPRAKAFNEELMKQVSYEGVNEVYKSRFNNAGDFVFTISGDFKTKELDKLIETYIATLPVSGEKEKFADNGVRAPKKAVKNHFAKKMNTPKASVYVNLHNKYKYNQENNIYGYVISQLLSKRYLEEIREKEGGTYGVGVRPSFKEYPYQELQLALNFDCDPEKAEKLKGIALAEIQTIIDGKVIESDLEDIKKNILKSRAERVASLGFWHSELTDYALENELMMTSDEYTKFIESINAKQVVKKAKKFFKKAVKVEVVMLAKAE